MCDGFAMERLDARNLEEMLAFDRTIVHGLDAGNPALASFLRDEHVPRLAVAGEEDHLYFVYRDGEPPQIVARCGIDLAPPEDDISGYGNAAARLYAAGKTASLVGDLVHPECRGQGLQTKMIGYRLEYLCLNGYDYAVAGIVDGNTASWDNYVALGFSPVGEKTIEWGSQPDRSDKVTLLAVRLRGRLSPGQGVP